MYPKDLKYTESHEWVKLENDIATIGITSHAIEELTDLTYLQFDVEEGDTIAKGDVFGVVESVKATSDLYTPVSGDIIEVNNDLGDMLEEMTQDPYSVGWMIKVKLADSTELDNLMSIEAYQKHASS